MARRGDVIEQFLDWLYVEEGRAPATVSAYGRSLRMLKRLRGPLERLTEEDLLRYQRARGARGGWPAEKAAIQRFYRWRSRVTGEPDPSRRLTAKPRARRQPSTRGLARRIERLDPHTRLLARFIRQTGLELAEALEVIRQTSPGPSLDYKSRGGAPRRIDLSPRAQEILRELRDLPRWSARWHQRNFQLAGMNARDVTAAAREDRRHGAAAGDALAALAEHPGLEQAEADFRTALAELEPGGSPDDAITDAAGALESALRARGARGRTLGALITDAKGKGVFRAHDTRLADAIELMARWVSDDRALRGDAHRYGGEAASRDDAWLTVSVVGALLIRLTRGMQ